MPKKDEWIDRGGYYEVNLGTSKENGFTVVSNMFVPKSVLDQVRKQLWMQEQIKFDRHPQRKIK